MQRATLMFVMITFLQYSLGIYLLSGRGNCSEIFRLLLIYATIAGLALNLNQITILELLFQPISMFGQATIPIMLVSLGYWLHDLQSFKWRHAVGGTSLRILGGFLVASLMVHLIDANAVNRKVCSCMARFQPR